VETEGEMGVHIPRGHLEGRASPRASVGVHLLVNVIRNTIVRWAFLSSLFSLFPLADTNFTTLFTLLMSAFLPLLSIRRLLLLLSLVVFPFLAAKYRQEQGVDDDEEEGDNRRSNDDRWHDDVLDDGEILVPEGEKGTDLGLWLGPGRLVHWKLEEENYSCIQHHNREERCRPLAVASIWLVNWGRLAAVQFSRY
jgi:hypothetical protein